MNNNDTPPETDLLNQSMVDVHLSRLAPSQEETKRDTIEEDYVLLADEKPPQAPVASVKSGLPGALYVTGVVINAAVQGLNAGIQLFNSNTKPS